MKLQNILARAIFSLVFLFNLGLTSSPTVIVTAEVLPLCSPSVPGGFCYHNFDSTTDATTGDSQTYQVSGCNSITYQHFATGGSTVQVLQCPTSTKSAACTIFAPDVDSDGRITLADEGVILDGTVGRRALVRMAPSAPYQYVNVLNPPSSGTATVTVMCEN